MTMIKATYENDWSGKHFEMRITDTLFQFIASVPQNAPQSTWDDVRMLCSRRPKDVHYIGDILNILGSKESFTVLQLAVIKNAPIEILRAIIQLKPVVQNEKNGWTALHTAIRYKVPYSIVEFLVKEFSIGDICCDKFELACANTPLGCNVLHLAASHKASADVVELLLTKFPGSISMQNKWGLTPIHLAIQSKVPNNILRLLIKYSPVEVLMISNYFGSNPLHNACAHLNGSSDDVILHMLSEAPGAVFVQNSAGSTPLMLACKHCVSPRVCAAIIKTMFPTKKNLEKLLPVPIDLIKNIVSFMANPIEATDTDKRNVLHWCALKNIEIGTVKLILERSTDISSFINQQNDSGKSPIDLCEEERNLKMLSILKRYGEI